MENLFFKWKSIEFPGFASFIKYQRYYWERGIRVIQCLYLKNGKNSAFPKSGWQDSVSEARKVHGGLPGIDQVHITC